MSYNDLTNIEELTKKEEEFNIERWEVSFYCRDCKEIVEVDRIKPNWYIFECKKCGERNISIWTSEGLKDHYKVK